MKRSRHLLGVPVVLFACWLLLNDSASPGHIALGAVLAVLLAWAARSLRPLHASMKHPGTALRLLWHVAVDIFHSNFAVARLIWLGPRSGATPGFLRIRLRMQDPHGLAMLACIITYTPGTVWADYLEEEALLTLHVLDLKDEEHWRNVILNRYERPLMEIFE